MLSVPLPAQNSRLSKEDSIFAFKKINVKEFEGIKVSDKPFGRAKQQEYYKDYVPVVIPEYFILGSLGNHLRRMGGSSLKKGEIDFFQPEEEARVEFLKKYVRENLDIDLIVTKDEKKGYFTTYSIGLSEIINSFFKKGSSLKYDLFHNEEEIYSYLLGVYYRYGTKTSDETYELRQTYLNTDRMFSILRKSQCPSICYKYHDAVPGGVSFIIKPGILLEKYFTLLEED
ncbi:MAG: hypothetical protein LIO93_03095, partial [Bacteroidales bacterium]|nr:hypothetical protein [Bacteroidales bacterium]